MPNVMVALGIDRRRPLLKMTRIESSIVPFLVLCRKVWLTPTIPVPCSNADKTGNARLGHKVNSAPGRIPKMYICSSRGDGQTSCQVWLTSVQHRRCSNEARTRYAFKYAGCPKPDNRPQPLVGRSSPCENMLKRYCCLTSFFRLLIHALLAK